MFGLRRKPDFDADTLSSIWVMASRDESPVVTAYSAAYRLGGITPEEVMELVKGRRELFRLGLPSGQSRGWKDRFRPGEGSPDGAAAGPSENDDKAKAGPKRLGLPDWLRVFDDEASESEQKRVREWLGDGTITSSRQALERFLGRGFVVDEIVFRSQFRADPDLNAEPSDLATMNWGLEHIDRVRRGRAENRQQLVALTTGIGGVAIGALVALTAPMMTTLYQGRPLDTARFTIDHQILMTTYGALGAAATEAERAATAGDGKALAAAFGLIDNAATTLRLLLDEASGKGLREQQARTFDACNPSTTTACGPALDALKALVDGPLAEAARRRIR